MFQVFLINKLNPWNILRAIEKFPDPFQEQGYIPIFMYMVFIIPEPSYSSGHRQTPISLYDIQKIYHNYAGRIFECIEAFLVARFTYFGSHIDHFTSENLTLVNKEKYFLRFLI
jgi:hypothetical protein